MGAIGYSTDLSDAQWALVEPHLPRSRPGGRRRKVNLRTVINAIFYLLGPAASGGSCLGTFHLGEPSGGTFGDGAGKGSGPRSTALSILWHAPRRVGSQGRAS